MSRPAILASSIFASSRGSPPRSSANDRPCSVRIVSGPTGRRHSPSVRRSSWRRSDLRRSAPSNPSGEPVCRRSVERRSPSRRSWSECFPVIASLPLQRYHRPEEPAPGFETTHPLDLCGMIVLFGNAQDDPLASCQRAVAAYFEAASGKVDDLDLDFAAVAVDKRRPDCCSDPRRTRRPVHTTTGPPWLWRRQFNIRQCSSQRLSSSSAGR